MIMRSPSPKLRTRLGAGAAVTLSATAAAVLPTPAAAVSDPPPGNWPTRVAGAANPLVGTPFQLNGGGATPAVRLRIGFGKRRVTRVTRRVDQRPILRGRLSNAVTGAGITGATLVVAAELTAQPGWKAVGLARTNGRGYFRSVQAAGLSRRFAVLYYPAVTTVYPIFSRRVLMRASPRVFLRTVDVGRRLIRFEGRVSGAPIPPGGLNVYVQVRNGPDWATARAPQTGANGRFVTRYRFRGTASRFTIRVFVPDQGLWPLYAGTSKQLRIRVR